MLKGWTVQVFKATRGGVQSVAVKVLKNKEDHATFGREIAILKNCRHPNIVQFQVCPLSMLNAHFESSFKKQASSVNFRLV